MPDPSPCAHRTNTALATNNVAAAPVTKGLYNVALDFGANAFNGDAGGEPKRPSRSIGLRNG